MTAPTPPAVDSDERAYADLADEMNDGDVVWRDDDWQTDTVERGARYAAENNLAWPPGTGDFDRYYEARHR